jgi:hypothetical protein
MSAIGSFIFYKSNSKERFEDNNNAAEEVKDQ